MTGIPCQFRIIRIGIDLRIELKNMNEQDRQDKILRILCIHVSVAWPFD